MQDPNPLKNFEKTFPEIQKESFTYIIFAVPKEFSLFWKKKLTSKKGLVEFSKDPHCISALLIIDFYTLHCKFNGMKNELYNIIILVIYVIGNTIFLGERPLKKRPLFGKKLPKMALIALKIPIIIFINYDTMKLQLSLVRYVLAILLKSLLAET